MDINEVLQDKRKLATVGGAVVVLLLLLVVVVRSLGGGGGGATIQPFNKAVYYDVDEKRVHILTIGSGARELPSPRDPGSGVYLATVYTCGVYKPDMLADGMTLAELESNGLKIGWIEKLEYDPVTGEWTGSYISRHDAVKWYERSSEGAADITQAPQRECEGNITWCKAK